MISFVKSDSLLDPFVGLHNELVSFPAVWLVIIIVNVELRAGELHLIAGSRGLPRQHVRGSPSLS